MDISQLNIPETAEIHLEFPTIGKLYADDDKKQAVTITVYSPASDVAVLFKRKQQQKASNLMAKKGQKGLYQQDFEENELDRLEILTAGVGNLVYKGEEITPKTIRSVYADPKMGWLRDQVAEKLRSWEDFLA